MSGAEWPSIKWPIQVYTRDHTRTDGRFVLEIEDRGISEELQSDEQSADRRFSFTAAFTTILALSAVQSCCISSKIIASSGARISSRAKEENHSKYFKCINLCSDLMYLTYTQIGIVQPVANFPLHFCTIVHARMF